jgi:hypothetical protein
MLEISDREAEDYGIYSDLIERLSHDERFLKQSTNSLESLD